MGTSTGTQEGELRPGPADALSAEKIEAIGIEYSYLLTSQLDSQRSYYEEQSTDLKRQVEELTRLVGTLSAEFEKERDVFKRQEDRRRLDEATRMAGLEKDKAKAEKKAEKVADLVKTLQKELKEERAVSEGLLKNLGKMKERVELSDVEKKDLTSKIADLQDQVRDVMFFLEAKAKIEEGSGPVAEAAGGSIEMLTPAREIPRTSRKKSPRKG
jgi:BRCA1-associated protein